MKDYTMTELKEICKQNKTCHTCPVKSCVDCPENWDTSKIEPCVTMTAKERDEEMKEIRKDREQIIRKVFTLLTTEFEPYIDYGIAEEIKTKLEEEC